jgi:RNA polymerase sigma factor (sigma-70 family)
VLGRDPEADDAFQATFLVLAKKADSVFWQESVGNWLYGVAYRTASKARTRSARRRQVEQQAAAQRGAAPTETGDAHDLQQVLDEELIRLPEKFRMPVLLCCLQDQTIDEAAQQLGWSFTTIKGRLQRGREMLRNRLQRRGIGLSAGVLAAILTQGVVNAIPPALLKTTVQTIVAGTLSDSVTTLAQGVMQAMFWTKLKVTAICLLALALTGIGFGAVFQRFSEVAAKAPLPDEIPAQKAKGPPATLVILEKDQGKTLAAVVGQAIEVQLEGDRKQTGWEDGCDPPVAHAKVVTPTSLLVRAGQDFQAQANAADSAIGTYIFKFRAIKEGEVELRFVYVSPGGNGYRGPRDATRKVKEFKATVKVSPAPVQSTGAKSEPLLQNGLEVVVKPTKASYAAGEAPTFEITYTNRTDKAYRLHDVGYEVSCFSLLDLGSNGPWQAGPWQYAARPAPRSVELAAGKSHVQSHTLRGPFTWQGAQFKPVKPRDALWPGKYRLTGKIVFGGERSNNAVPFWSGEIATAPVEFEIAAQAAAPLSVKDANSGLTVTVTDDAKALTATDAAGKEIWKLNLIASVKDFLGTPAIGSVAINDQGQVEARFGKSNLARIDLKTGKLLEHLAR